MDSFGTGHCLDFAPAAQAGADDLNCPSYVLARSLGIRMLLLRMFDASGK